MIQHGVSIRAACFRFIVGVHEITRVYPCKTRTTKTSDVIEAGFNFFRTHFSLIKENIGYKIPPLRILFKRINFRGTYQMERIKFEYN